MAAEEGDIEPEGEPVYVVGLRDMKLEWYVDCMQILFMCFEKVHRMFVGFGDTDTDVECVYYWLVEVFLQCCIA